MSKVLYVEITASTHQALKVAAALEGVSMKDFVLTLIEQKLQPSDRPQSERKPIAA